MRPVSIVSQLQRNAPPDGALSAMAAALTAQATRHFGPAWDLGFCPVDVGGSGWPLVLLDAADVANALGYHDVGPDGRPYSRIFVEPVLAYGGGSWLGGPLSVSAVCSHELLEMLADETANRWADDGSGRLWALEVCDPVEGDAYAITPRGKPAVAVSNFVFPEFFDAGESGRVDHMGTAPRPFSLAKGGYAIVASEGKISQVFGDGHAAAYAEAKAWPWARTQRRLAAQLR